MISHQDYTLDPSQINLNDASKDNIDALEMIAKNLLNSPVTSINPLTGLQESPMGGSQSVNGSVQTNFKAIQQSVTGFLFTATNLNLLITTQFYLCSALLIFAFSSCLVSFAKRLSAEKRRRA